MINVRYGSNAGNVNNIVVMSVMSVKLVMSTMVVWRVMSVTVLHVIVR